MSNNGQGRLEELVNQIFTPSREFDPNLLSITEVLECRDLVEFMDIRDLTREEEYRLRELADKCRPHAATDPGERPGTGKRIDRNHRSK